MGLNSMKKYIVLSVNDNCDYLYFTPLTCWAWRKFGWEPILFYNRNEKTDRLTQLEELIINVPGNELLSIKFVKPIDGYRSDTITQISRLYGSCAVNDDCYLMTGDIDMLPLSDYWKPNLNKVSVYGHDLTGYGHFPICYVGAPDVAWDTFMDIAHPYDYNFFIKRDLDTLPQAKNPDFYKYWFSDQDLITERIKQYGTGKIDFINRGQYPNGFAKGRVDRGSWTLDHETLIDAHLMQQTHHSQEKIDKLMELLRHVWPNEDFTWFRDYTNKFRELAK